MKARQHPHTLSHAVTNLVFASKRHNNVEKIVVSIVMQGANNRREVIWEIEDRVK